MNLVLLYLLSWFSNYIANAWSTEHEFLIVYAKLPESKIKFVLSVHILQLGPHLTDFHEIS
jgi:hypothetical protein